MRLPGPSARAPECKVHREGTVPDGPCVSSGELVSGCDALYSLNCPGSWEHVGSDDTAFGAGAAALAPLWLLLTCLSVSEEVLLCVVHHCLFLL